MDHQFTFGDPILFPTNLKKSTSYFISDSVKSTSEIIHYNNKGLKVKEITFYETWEFYPEMNVDSISSVRNYYYDATGTLTMFVSDSDRFRTKGDTTYISTIKNKNNDPLLETFFQINKKKDSILISSMSYTYNEQGLLKSKTPNPNYDDPYEIRETYKYDKLNRLKSINYIWVNSFEKSILKYQYDENVKNSTFRYKFKDA